MQNGLLQIIKELQRHRFGRRAKSLPEGQLLLALEGVEQREAGEAEANEAKSPSAGGGSAQTARQPWRPADLHAAHRDPRRRRRQDLPVLQGRAAPDRRGRKRATRRIPTDRASFWLQGASFRSMATLAIARLQTKVRSASASAGRIRRRFYKPRRRSFAHRQRGAAAHRLALSDGNRHSWRRAGQATRRPPGTIASAFRRTRTVAARKASPRQPEELARPSDPLCALALGSRWGELGRHRLAN